MAMSRVFCRATINYLPGASARSQVEVDIHDGRVSELPGWEECGFELVHHASSVTDWDDEAQLTSIHHAEIEELAQKMTGSDVALVSAHIKRSPQAAQQHHQLSPITFVHSDFAAAYVDNIRATYRDPGDGAVEAMARNNVSASDVERASRIVILQFWRNVGPARMDYPIAFCDARTVPCSDGHPFRVTNYAGSGATFDALGIVAPQRDGDHQWYSFPELRVDETVAFRTYDTDLVASGQTYFTPHSAFRDPSVPVGRPARSSIELRATCLFE
jgi:hypothetical protein